MYLILAPADISYLTGVIIHEIGEVMILVKQENMASHSAGSCLASWRHADLSGMTERGIIFCDARTRGLFDGEHYIIIADREKWGDMFRTYETLQTDPDVLTQTLRTQIEEFGVQLTMAPSPIAAKRMIKTPEEIEILRKSQHINRAVFDAIQPFLHRGITEEEVARRIQILQLELGGSGPSFPPIVAFGENTAVPHHSPTDRALQPGDVILIDMGVVYQGYCSDMTRCLMPKE